MEMLLLKIDSVEWNWAWTWLAEHPINEGIEDPRLAPNENRAWEYMGSVRQKDKVLTTFQHKNHPKTGGLYKVIVEHNQVNEDSIEKIIKLK